MKIKVFIKEFHRKIGRFFELNSDEYIYSLRKKGIQIGIGCKIFYPSKTEIDTTRPWMLKIGDYVKITQGCIILCHDYSRSVLRRAYGEILAEGKNTVIGNNVFLGMNSIVLAGSKIGNNVIVGAGSVVSGVIPDNVVIAGNPARIVRTLEEHYQIRKAKTVEEAKNNFLCYKERYGKIPEINPHMGHFFPLFLHTEEELKQNGISLKWSGDEESEILQSFLSQNHPYESYADFLKKEGLE